MYICTDLGCIWPEISTVDYHVGPLICPMWTTVGGTGCRGYSRRRIPEKSQGRAVGATELLQFASPFSPSPDTCYASCQAQTLCVKSCSIFNMCKTSFFSRCLLRALLLRVLLCVVRCVLLCSSSLLYADLCFLLLLSLLLDSSYCCLLLLLLLLLFFVAAAATVALLPLLFAAASSAPSSAPSPVQRRSGATPTCCTQSSWEAPSAGRRT